ncbi:hypothetical protein [Rhodococcus rhodochrous]|uniref:hypothetical protein n=1 Tax=Rhodococcus rhodochrous TaxID=1829 RepID=UPI0024BBDB2D|nr:hypothetical protein [Rhodococcus rhodochrous]MDJ0400777.1 hypothetical protein [Rhodococcus rhodochrous]
MNNGVNDIEWLTAVSEHPETLDAEVAVAAAVVFGDANRAEDVEGMDPDDVQDCIEELVSLGFLEETVAVDGVATTELIYELRIPLQ